jgi:hypothetical protein
MRHSILSGGGSTPLTADSKAIAVKGGAGNGVVGSTYDGDKTVASASSTREAIPSGSSSIEVYNQGATNFMRFRFGDSTVDATTTTGFFVDTGERLAVPVPSAATHWAYIADTADVTASVVWGG